MPEVLNENHENLYNQLDGAEAETSKFAQSISELRAIASDHSKPLETRIEAFEDIFESEVGDTALTRARNIERELDFRQLYLKFEGGNPTGTQKDRIAFLQVLDALRRGYDTVTMATCGNYGAAMALAASLAGLKCIIYIPEGYHSKRLKEMEGLSAEIHKTPGDYEKAVNFSQEMAKKNEWYDANPGGNNTLTQLNAYGTIAYEIYDELRDAPAAISVPVSNGTTLAGIYKGFLSLYRRGKTSRMPKFVAGSSFNKNPIVQAYIKHHPKCEDLKPEKIRESNVNEPLINWHSIDGDYALEAIRKTKGWAANATDKMMTDYSKMLREKEGYYILPAATAGLIAMMEKHRAERLPGDRYVVLLTGKKA